MMFAPEKLIRDYLYPVFRAKNDEELLNRMTIGVIIYAVATLCIKNAPYGRYANKNFGFGVNPKLSWVIQESPAFFIPLFLILWSEGKAYRNISNQIFIGLFTIHYFQRSFIFSLLVKSSNPMPFLPFMFAFLTCCFNGILHGMYFVVHKPYNDEVWMKTVYFWIGLVMFITGMRENIRSDSILRGLRRGQGGKEKYKIPRGGLFEFVSCANYLGEIVEMWGYAIVTMAPPAIAHAIFTTLFLARRALDHHDIIFRDAHKQYFFMTICGLFLIYNCVPVFYITQTMVPKEIRGLPQGQEGYISLSPLKTIEMILAGVTVVVFVKSYDVCCGAFAAILKGPMGVESSSIF